MTGGRTAVVLWLHVGAGKDARAVRLYSWMKQRIINNIPAHAETTAVDDKHHTIKSKKPQQLHAETTAVDDKYHPITSKKPQQL